MRVYLAGPIRGCTDDECKGWRERAKSLLAGCEVLDPMTRDYRGKEVQNVDAIVKGDLRDIESSHVLLVNASGQSWGTPMEIVYAKLKFCCRVVAFGAGDRPSPWLAYHAELFSTLEDACAAVLRVR